jgi:hypothetical protein
MRYLALAVGCPSSLPRASHDRQDFLRPIEALRELNSIRHSFIRAVCSVTASNRYDFLLSEERTSKPSHTANYLIAICANSYAFDNVRSRSS